MVEPTDIADLDRRDPELIRRVGRVLNPVLKAMFRPRVRGLERIPAGAGLYVGNHNAGTLMPDTYIFGLSLFHNRPLADVPLALAHDIVMDAPWARDTFPRLGAVRASQANAERLFAAERKLLVYPGGDLDSMRAWRDRNRIRFGKRRGYIRLALRSDVPVIPVVAAGAHETFRILTDGRRLAKLLRLDKLLRVEVLPITLALPWGIVPGPLVYLPMPTKILIEVLEPIRFSRSGPEAAADAGYVEVCHEHVHRTMETALQRLARERSRLLRTETRKPR